MCWSVAGCWNTDGNRSLARLIVEGTGEAFAPLTGGLREPGSDVPLPVGLSELSGLGDSRARRVVAGTGHAAQTDGEGDHRDECPDGADHRSGDDRDRLDQRDIVVHEDAEWPAPQSEAGNGRRSAQHEHEQADKSTDQGA
jgi:hypothetical protein